MDYEYNVNIVVQSPPIPFFMVNFNVNKLEEILPELLNMFKDDKTNLKKEKGQAIMVVQC